MDFKHIVLWLLVGLAIGGLAVGVPVASVNAESQAIIQEYKQEIEDKDLVIQENEQDIENKELIIQEYKQDIENKELIIDEIKDKINTNDLRKESLEILEKVYKDYTGYDLRYTHDETCLILKYGFDVTEWIAIREDVVSAEDGLLLKYIFSNYNSLSFYKRYTFNVYKNDISGLIDVVTGDTAETIYSREKLTLNFSFINENGNYFDINTLLEDTLYSYEFKNINYVVDDTFTLSCDVVIKIVE